MRTWPRRDRGPAGLGDKLAGPAGAGLHTDSADSARRPSHSPTHWPFVRQEASMRVCRGPEGAVLELEHVELAQAVPAVGPAMVMRAPPESPRNRWVAVIEWRRAGGE